MLVSSGNVSRLSLFGLLGTATGCSDWPRYQNKPSTNHDALSPDTAPSEGVPMKWSDPVQESEPNDSPSTATPIAPGEGIILNGTLDGIGWDADQNVERISECGEGLAFPPAAPGNYMGDVDWITISPSEVGLLCMQLDTDELDVQLDVVLYTLDDCGEPVSLFVHEGTATPVGSGRHAGQVRWALVVESDTLLGVGMGAFWPDEEETELNWTAHLAMVPSVTGSADLLCPEIK